MRKKLLGIILIIILYIIIGSSIPFVWRKDVSEGYKKDFDIGKFYQNDSSIAYAYPIRDNDQARIERIRAIDNAKDKLIIGSYRLRSDESGKLYMASLIEAAKRGVDIDIILDGNSLWVNAGKNNYYKALASFDNVNIKIYNPIRILKPRSLNGRMHDKYMIVDDEILFLGGRNLEDRFLISDKKQSYDWDVLLYMEKAGDKDVLSELTDYFYSVYNKGQDLDQVAIFASNRHNDALIKELIHIYEANKNQNPGNFEKINYKDKAVKINKASLITNPIDFYSKEPEAFYEISKLMLNAKDNVTIHSPYFIADRKMYETIEQIADNADTSLFTNSAANNANLIGTGDLLINKRKFKTLGVNILLNSKENSYHGKAFTIDDDLAAVGSFNWDMRSVYIDTELMLVINGKDFNKLIKKDFAYYQDDASIVKKDGQIINSTGKAYEKASPAKKVISLLLVILLFPFRFLF
ncbi:MULTISPECIES: phosphatidylserine/phosphatidylglycerophosphate/cardiolipin synthase family protein [Anaerococcus]|uniref:phospholipase D-like domain-containing protein n=1 Tax=Anaerococcus TaxID=165779 RepID=UPI0002F3AB34|nr:MULTISPECIES: phosphatidylserine/phosphatidylglycerophosphate/cardiolipin synthase family protein [Anaerococcus]